ncbi:MAG: DoxX family protein [Cyclobacteriaceae bacterium]|jgi:putative oxidoreductase|nr:DoxX family protein [Cyclobacteriaceae bacterium]
MKFNHTLILRWAVAIILIMHSVSGMFNNGVNDFGNLYLNQIGFNPIGVPLAWAIKLSHLAAAICLILEKYIRWAAIITIVVLLSGIAMIHFKEGWFVVGGGRNGMEFNFLLIAALLTIMFPNGLNGLRR